MMNEGKNTFRYFIRKKKTIWISFKNRIHTKDKIDVGYRLSRAGLAVAYGFKNITYQGPIIIHIEVSSDSKRVNVTYSSVVSTSIELRNPAGFEVCFIFIKFIKNVFFFL